MPEMRKLLSSVTVVAVLATGVAARAGEPSIVAPYRFQAPPVVLSPAEQQGALTYRSELQGQLNRLERHRSNEPLSPREENRLFDTRRELDRMNRILVPAPRLPGPPEG